MAQITGPFFADVAGAGQANSGEIVHVTIVGTDGTRQPILFSHKLIPKLITAILAGGSLASEVRMRRHGIKAAGEPPLRAQALRVRSIDVGVAESRSRLDLIFRLHLQEGVSFDVALAPELAERLLDGLRQIAGGAEKKCLGAN